MGLVIDFQGQQLPVSFALKQKEGSFEGDFESPFGNGLIKEGIIKGSKIKAKISVDFQGQPVDILMSGNIENGNEVSGILAPQMDGLPELPFTGNRNG